MYYEFMYCSVLITTHQMLVTTLTSNMFVTSKPLHEKCKRDDVPLT